MTGTIVDSTGASIEANRIIVYASLSGRSAVLRYGLVRHVKEGGKVGIYTEHGSKATLSYPGRCVCLDDARVPAEKLRKFDQLRSSPIGPVIVP